MRFWFIRNHMTRCKENLHWLAAKWPTGTTSSVIKMVLRLMLVAITQETEQLHFNWSQFFTFVADSYPTSQHCVHKSVMPDPTLLPPLTHLIYIPAGNLCTICSDSQRHLLVYLGSCYAVIIPPLLHLKLCSLSWNHNSCALQMCCCKILHLALTWLSQWDKWILLQFTSCKVGWFFFFFFLQ